MDTQNLMSREAFCVLKKITSTAKTPAPLLAIKCRASSGCNIRYMSSTVPEFSIKKGSSFSLCKYF